MPAQYCVRLYKFDTRIPTPDAGPATADTYGPSKALAGWAANFGTGADFSEQLASFTDPDQNRRISNVNAIAFRCGNVGEGDRDVVYAGLVTAASIGAQRAGLPTQAIPLAVIALPGGRKRVVGAGRYDLAAGALTFQLS